MAEQLGSLARTHTCGALRSTDVGKDVVLLGWVHRVRDLGSLLFLDVRDRHGLTQVIVEGDAALLERAKPLRSEFVVAILGEVWAIPAAALGPFLAEIPPPLGFTRVRLDDGSTPLGFIAEPAGVAGLPDISASGGWRKHMETR